MKGDLPGLVEPLPWDHGVVPIQDRAAGLRRCAGGATRHRCWLGHAPQIERTGRDGETRTTRATPNGDALHGAAPCSSGFSRICNLARISSRRKERSFLCTSTSACLASKSVTRLDWFDA